MIEISWATLPLYVFAILVAVLGVGRLTRVITYDDFPPARWVREKWVEKTDGTGWQLLAICWWCASFWVALACAGWWVAGLFFVWAAWAWWIFWGSLAISYLAAMVIVRDTPEE